MSSLKKMISKFSIADWLAYEVPKKVVIRDPAVGLLHICALLLTFAYFAVWRIYIDMGYLKREPIFSVVQTSIKAPDNMERVASLSYCEDGKADARVVLPCVTGPDPWIMAPSIGTEEMFVATRVKESEDGTTTRAFTQNPEDYTLGITFTLQALTHYADTADPKYSKSIVDLETELVDVDGVAFRSAVTRISRFDVIKVRTLLYAAGLQDLDRAHDADDEVSFRYDGLILFVQLSCPMEYDGTISRCQYSVKHLAKSVAETFVASEVKLGEAAGFQERRGIKIIISAAGDMGRFDLGTLLISWISSMVLVELAAIVITWAMNYVLPFRKTYRVLMYEESPSFHDLRAGGKKAQASVDRIMALSEYNKAERPNPFINGGDSPAGSRAGTPSGARSPVGPGGRGMLVAKSSAGPTGSLGAAHLVQTPQGAGVGPLHSGPVHSGQVSPTRRAQPLPPQHPPQPHAHDGQMVYRARAPEPLDLHEGVEAF